MTSTHCQNSFVCLTNIYINHDLRTCRYSLYSSIESRAQVASRMSTSVCHLILTGFSTCLRAGRTTRLFLKERAFPNRKTLLLLFTYPFQEYRAEASFVQLIRRHFVDVFTTLCGHFERTRWFTPVALVRKGREVCTTQPVLC